MGKIVYGARRLRLELQQREGRSISMQEIANAVKLERIRINKIEMGAIKEVKASELLVLCSFYTERLGRFVDTNEILRFDPNDKTTLDMAAA
jgi:DNA-binding Xre family transcriptional regulator